MKLCSWCQKNPVKLAKNETCSRSCGSAQRWFRMSAAGRLLQFKRNHDAAKKTLYAKRLRVEIEKACEELGITFSQKVAKLYVRARNKGYHNGYYTRDRRAKKPA